MLGLTNVVYHFRYQNLTLADTFFGHARPWHAPDMLKDMYYDFERQELYMNVSLCYDVYLYNIIITAS